MADADETYRRALEAGAEKLEAPQDTPYGDRRAMVRDPYGNVFTTDPVNGYPPGTPDTPTERSFAGTLHDLVSIPTFLGLPMAATAYAWRFARSGQPGWAAYSASTGMGMLAAFALSAAGFNQSQRFVDTAGLWQRVCIATGFTWLTALMGRALHES